MKNIELYERPAEQLFDMGLDVITCVRFLKWSAEKERNRRGKTLLWFALEASVENMKNVLRKAGYDTDAYIVSGGKE
jgi:hypothetical protein